MTKILTWTVGDAGPYNLRRALGETNFKMLSLVKEKSKINRRKRRIESLLLEEKVARETSRMRCSRPQAALPFSHVRAALPLTRHPERRAKPEVEPD